MDMKGTVLRILPRRQANAEKLIKLLEQEARKGDLEAMLTLIEERIARAN